MSVAAWLIVLGGFTFYFNDWLAAQRNPNQQVTSITTGDGVNEVFLKRNRSGHYVSTGYINGQKVEFLLDTGATHVAIPANIAKELGLARGAPISYQTANGEMTGYTTIIERIQLGDIVVHDVRAGITPNQSGEILLGMTFLKDLEFTQRNATLILRQYPEP